jgi:hypothetical protein
MDGFDLEQIAALAEIVGVVTIVSGLIFGIFQLRAHRVQQRNAVATSLAKTFYNTEFARAALLLHRLPDGAGADELRAKGPEFEDAAVVICTSFETMGLLLYRRIAEFDIVMDLAGGMASSMFRKLEGWIRSTREEQNQPSWAEWFEWLARMSSKYKDEHAVTRAEAANWRP